MQPCSFDLLAVSLLTYQTEAADGHATHAHDVVRDEIPFVLILVVSAIRRHVRQIRRDLIVGQRKTGVQIRRIQQHVIKLLHFD